MNTLTRGFRAGLIATLALSVLMVMKMVFGLMPQLDTIALLAKLMGTSQAIAWLVHIMVGTLLFGGVFAYAYDRIPGANSIAKGMIFSAGAWLIMMLFVMPVAGAGLFGWSLGVAAPFATLLLHLVYGYVLGGTFAEAAGRSSIRIAEEPPLWRR